MKYKFFPATIKVAVYFIFAMMSNLAVAQITYVTPAGAGLMDGSSWANALDGNTANSTGSTRLALALKSATPGTWFWIAEGTYTCSTNDRDQSFELKENLKLYGGFEGTESDTLQRNISLHPTIFSGDIGVPGDSTDNTKVILKTVEVPWTNYSFIDGISFKYGCNGQENAVAAGIFNSGSVRINSCNVAHNLNNGNGSGIYSTGNLHVVNCTIEHNTALIAGGGIYNTGYVTVSNSDISQNAVKYYGGGIYNSGTGLCNITASSFSFNSANGPYTWINAGEYGGGGAYNLGVLNIEKSKICNNETQWSGGGLFHPTLVKNCLIANNSMGGDQFLSYYYSTTGGGIRINSGFQGIFNSTIVNNIGEGITSFQVNDSGYFIAIPDTFELHNCILYGNYKQTSGHFNASNSCIEGGYNEDDNIYVKWGSTLCPDGGLDENHNICDYPAFIAPSAGKGHTYDGLNADWSLPGCSVCINMGDNAWLGEGDSLDISGAPRIFNEVVDMGAYELQAGPVNLVDYGSGIVYVNDSVSQGGSGTTWMNALSGNMPSCRYTGYTLLYEAIRDVPDSCRVWVKKGVYKPCTDNDRSKSFHLYAGNKLYGGFGGTESDFTQREINMNPTVLSGDIGIAGDSLDNSFHIITSRFKPGSISDEAFVSGFTFRDANANGEVENSNGGCILNEVNAEIQVEKSIFNNNFATTGAVIFNLGSAFLTSCKLTENQSSGSVTNGISGIFIGDSLEIGPENTRCILNLGSLFLKNSSVTGSFTTNWWNDDASASNRGNATFLNCSIRNISGCALNNSDSLFLKNCRIDSTKSSGGAFVNSGYTEMQYCSMSHDSAGTLTPSFYQSGSPGGILNSGTLRMKGSIMKNNDAVGPGGGIQNSGNLWIDSSYFEKNNGGVRPPYYIGGNLWVTFIAAHFSGGAIHNSSGQAVITNTIFNGNRADYGGAIANMAGKVTLSNCKLVNNFSLVSGAALFNHSQMDIRNCLYANNYSDAAKQVGGIIACGKGGKYQFRNCDIVNNTSSKFLVTGVDEYETYQFDPNLTPDTVLISNSIIWGNDTLVNNPNSSLISTKYSCTQQIFPGTGNIHANPVFLNPTAGNDTSYNALVADWRLSACSPCINAGADSLCSDSLDLAGNVRKYNTIDMGALEMKYDSSVTAVWNSNTTTTTAGLHWRSRVKPCETVVFIKDTVEGEPLPVPGTIYNADSVFGSGSGQEGWYCVYKGMDSTVMITGLTRNTTYRAAVFNVILDSIYDVPALWNFTTLSIDEQAFITNDTVINGESVCFDAIQTITVAGNGTTFRINSGGSATLIAGENIQVLPGASITEGGYLHGYISPGGPWCQMPALPSIISSTFKTNEEDSPGFAKENGFRLYPNPTTGSFTVELSADADKTPVTVQCFNMTGSLVLQKEIVRGRKLEMTLAGRESGIYVVRVTGNEFSGFKKIIKTN